MAFMNLNGMQPNDRGEIWANGQLVGLDPNAQRAMLAQAILAQQGMYDPSQGLSSGPAPSMGAGQGQVSFGSMLGGQPNDFFSGAPTAPANPGDPTPAAPGSTTGRGAFDGTGQMTTSNAAMVGDTGFTNASPFGSRGDDTSLASQAAQAGRGAALMGWGDYDNAMASTVSPSQPGAAMSSQPGSILGKANDALADFFGWGGRSTTTPDVPNAPPPAAPPSDVPTPNMVPTQSFFSPLPSVPVTPVDKLPLAELPNAPPPNTTRVTVTPLPTAPPPSTPLPGRPGAPGVPGESGVSTSASPGSSGFGGGIDMAATGGYEGSSSVGNTTGAAGFTSPGGGSGFGNVGGSQGSYGSYAGSATAPGAFGGMGAPGGFSMTGGYDPGSFSAGFAAGAASVGGGDTSGSGSGSGSSSSGDSQGGGDNTGGSSGVG